MALGAWLIVEQQRHALLDTVETTARLRVEDLASQLEDGALPESLAVPFGDESFAQVVDAQGRVVRASENVSGERAVIAFVPEAGGSDARSVTATPLGNATFRVVARAVDAPVGGFVIYVGQSTGPVVEGSRALMRSLLFGVPLLVLLVGVVAWSVSGRALRPVVRMRREVDSITERDLHRRLAEPGTDDEIAGLAHTMNSMLDRLDAAVYRQRRFVSDASHELRSPLTAIARRSR
ncbi:MAG: HAMP domain-containing protein [Acidimicrobiia bacterium]|nr:HAMP domain-containing protein [Acidimicrobiia bacterium]